MLFSFFLVLVKVLHRTRHKTLLCKAKIATFCKAFVFYNCTTRIALLLKTKFLLHSAKALRCALQKFYIAQGIKLCCAKQRLLRLARLLSFIFALQELLNYSKQGFCCIVQNFTACISKVLRCTECIAKVLHCTECFAKALRCAGP